LGRKWKKRTVPYRDSGRGVCWDRKKKDEEIVARSGPHKKRQKKREKLKKGSPDGRNKILREIKEKRKQK